MEWQEHWKRGYAIVWEFETFTFKAWQEHWHKHGTTNSKPIYSLKWFEEGYNEFLGEFIDWRPMRKN